MNDRAGKFVLTPEGYRSFIPKELPPEPPIQYDDELHLLLSKADRNLARLDGITSVLPNPDLFIAMYVKKEALLSSQIEGTQASLEGVLEFEADLVTKKISAK
jgi:Fic family protein